MGLGLGGAGGKRGERLGALGRSGRTVWKVVLAGLLSRDRCLIPYLWLGVWGEIGLG